MPSRVARSRKRNPDSSTSLLVLLAVGAAAVYYFSKRSASNQATAAPPVLLPVAPTVAPPASQAPPAQVTDKPKTVKVKSIPLAAKQKALNAIRQTVYDYSAKVMGDGEPLSLFEPLVEDGDPGSKSKAALAQVLYTMEYGKQTRAYEVERFRKPECRWFTAQNASTFAGALEREQAIRNGKPDWYAADITLIESLTKSSPPTADDLWYVYAGARSATGNPVPKLRPSMRDFTG